MRIDDKYEIYQDAYNFVLAEKVEYLGKKGESKKRVDKRYYPTLDKALDDYVADKVMEKNTISNATSEAMRLSREILESKEKFKSCFRTEIITSKP